MFDTLAKLFHRRTGAIPTHIPQDPADWPVDWTTVFFKKYPRFPTIPLEHTATEAYRAGDAIDLLAKRASHREFQNARGFSKTELSRILQFGAGIKQRPPVDGDRNEWNRTTRFYPSGGARYPLELYLSISRSPDIAAGLYHYNVKEHVLELLLERGGRDELVGALSYPWSKDAPVHFIITSVWGRSLNKYGDFGYRIVLLEAGHLAHNLHLLTVAEGGTICSLAGFSMEKVDTLLDIHWDGRENSVYVLAAGVA